MKLHLALSGVPRAGYANVNPFADWDHKVADLACCEDAEATEILAPDYLDFVPRDATGDTLDLFRRKLRMGGRLVVGGLDLREVGRRLAQIALARDYGRPVVYQGPEYAGLRSDGDALRVRFEQADGLQADGEVRGFEVAGADRVFRPARAQIDGREVVVRSADVPAPVAVRYAWRNCPEANLRNGAGLPAVPFRSDDWPVSR